jgi:hypothetical protein
MNEDKFLGVVTKYPPNKLTLFLQKNFFSGFSKTTIIGKIFLGVLIISFFIMFFYVVKYPNLGYYSNWDILMTSSFWLFSLIFPLGFVSFITFIGNKLRIKKICRLLNITTDQYNYYISMWGNKLNYK